MEVGLGVGDAPFDNPDHFELGLDDALLAKSPHTKTKKQKLLLVVLSIVNHSLCESYDICLNKYGYLVTHPLTIFHSRDP